MTKALSNGSYATEVVQAAGLSYLGEETITMDGSSKTATLPTGTNMIEVSAEAGDVLYSLNGAASANSGGYVPMGQVRFVFKLDNLTSFRLFGSASAKAHILYYSEP